MPTSNRLIHADSGRVLLRDLRLAITFWRRLRGLLGAAPLGPEQGLWLEPCNSVHMFGMRYPLDVVFLDRTDRIIRLYRALAPGRISPIIRGARAAVELAVGTIDRLGLAEGDRLRWE